MNTTYYRRIANPGGNNYIEATFDKQVYNNLASSTSTFNVFKLKDSQKQYLEKITVNSSNIDLDNSNYLTIANHTFDSNISAKIYKITKKCLDDKGLASKDIVVRIFINEDINDLYGLFENLGTNYLKKITFNIDTSNVTNMGYMFQGASYLTEIEFKKFNSSKVTTFAGMFNNCSSITTLNLNRVSSNSVQSMYKTFEGCSSLETLNISNWNTSNVKDMSYMFSGCIKLKNIQLGSNFKVTNVTDMTYMFANCFELNTIGATENTIDLSNFSASIGCNCSHMFSVSGDMDKTITVKLGSLKVTNCSYMFTDSKFTTVNLNIYSSKSIDTSNMFDIRTVNNLETVTFSNTSESLKSNNCSYMFYNCINITNISFNSFDTSACTNMQYMFYKCSSLQTLDISGFITSKVTNFSNMFAYCTKLNKITTNQNNFVLDASVNLSSMFLNCTSLKTLGGTDNKVYIKNNNNINSCTDISYMFESCKAMTSCQLVNFTSTTLTSVGFMLGNCTSLKTLNINGLGGGNISNGSSYIFIFGTKHTNTTDVFGAPSLTNLTINNFNFGNLQDFTGNQTYNGVTISSYNILLHNCPKLTTCTFTNWTMINVLSLENFFNPIKSSVTTVNLNGLMTSIKLDSLRGMFSGCTKLTTIKGLNRNSETNGSVNLVISGVSDMSYMFNDCSSLTTLDLTGFYVSNACLETIAMFNHCESLTKIDLTEWDSNNIKECYAMFSNCHSLKEIVNIKNFVTSTCTDPHGMFNNCYELVELDLSGWNTSNVTTMEKLFYMDNYCNLKLITTSTYFKLKDGINLSNIFNKENENTEDCGKENPGLGIYYYQDLGKIIIDEDSGAESKLANINDPYFSLEIINESTNSFKYGKYEYLPNNWQPQIIKRNYILAKYDGALETSISDYRNFVNPNYAGGWDIYVYSESKIGSNITYDENNLITDINYSIFDTLSADLILQNSTDYENGVYWLKICPNNTNTYLLNYLFCDCRNITYVDFSTFKFYYKDDNNEYKYYTSASHCLERATNLKQCKMTSAADRLVDTVGMFSGCESLVKFEANGFTAQNIVDAEQMFSYCTSLKDGSQFNSFTFDNLENASYIFKSSGLENINIEIGSAENIDFYSAFDSCTSLITATVKFTYAKDISCMFKGCTNLGNVFFNSYIYINTGITTIPDDFESLNNHDTRGYGLISVFQDCINLSEIEFVGGTGINTIYTSGYVSCYAMFYATSVLGNLWIHISRDSRYERAGVLTTNRMFGQTMLSRGSLKNFHSNIISCYIESYCLQDTSYMFYQSRITGLALDIRNYGYSNDSYGTVVINNMSYMFAHCNVLSYIVNKREDILEGQEKYTNHTFDLSWLRTSDACNCTGMFEGTSSRLYLYYDNKIDTDGERDRIEEFNKYLIDNYDTTYTTSMLIHVILGPIIASDCSNMFYHGGYNKYLNHDTGKLPLYIKSIDFSEFNTSQCKSIENMFRGCIFIKELNLESLDLSKVTNMDYAFYNYVHILNVDGGEYTGYNEDTPLHLPENEINKDGTNYIINKLSVIRTYTDFNSNVSCNNLFHKGYEDDYVYTYFDGVFYYKQHAKNIGQIIPNSDTNPSIYANGTIKYNGNHNYIPDNWMGLPIIESDYFLVYYDALPIEANSSIFGNINKTIINTNLDNSDIKIFEVPMYNYKSLNWGINPELYRDDFYTTEFSNLDLEKQNFYINSNWKEIDINAEYVNNQSVYIVLRERSDLSYLFENCTCNLNIMAGPQTIEIRSIEGLFKNCKGLGFKHLNPVFTENPKVYVYGAGNINSYNLLDKITNADNNCLRELYAGCSNIISNFTNVSHGNELSEENLKQLSFNFYPIYICVWMNDEITSFANLFNGCSNIRNIDCESNGIGTLNVDSINDVSGMFNNCSNLIQINKTDNITFDNISNFESVFENCEKLESGADSFFDLEEQPIGNAKSMFKNCKKLVFENNESVGSNWNISTSTTDLSNMFYNCFELKGVDMSNWNIYNVTDMSGMFYMNGDNNVNLSKVNFVSSDSYLPSSVNINNLFNKEADNANNKEDYAGYIYPSQTEPTTGSFTYVEGNNVKQFLPDKDINPELTNGLWSRFGDHAVIPSNWNASYIISGDDGYVLMVYRPDYTTTSDGKIYTFDHETLLMNSDYYTNSGNFRSHINYTAITTDKGGSSNDDLSQLYSIAATSTYDGTAVSFKTLKAYSYEKTDGTIIYKRDSNLTQTQIDNSVTDYDLTDLSVPVGSTVSNKRVINTFYVNDSIKNSRIIAKVKFTEYLNTFCYHSDNIDAGIFDNGDDDNIKLYKIDFSRSRSFWYGNNPEQGVDKFLNEDFAILNKFETYENDHNQQIYSRGLKDCYRAFYNCNLLDEIKFKDESDDYVSDPWGMFTKTFTNTSYMFYGCSSLKSLNIKCFNTKNVDQMKYMFYGCSNLETLEFTHAQITNDGYYIGFDTYNNLLFGYMFGECSKLHELNLKGFYFNEDKILNDTSEGHYLTDMFYNCTSLQYLMLPDISRFLYRMFRKYNGDDNKIKYIKILIRSLFNTKFGTEFKPILYCEFDSIVDENLGSLETPEWLFGDQGCTGYSDEDGTILDIMFNILPNNWTIQPSTNKIFIYIENSATSNPFYVIKYGDNIKSINIYNDSTFKQINNEFKVYNDPSVSNKEIYKTYYIYGNNIKDINNKNDIYIQKTGSSSISGLIVEIIFKNYFDNYLNNFDTSYLFSCESNTSYEYFINTIPSEDNKININGSSKLKKIYLHSFGIRNEELISLIPKFNVKSIFNSCGSLTNIFNLDILKYSTNIKNESSNSLKTIISYDASNAFNMCSLITNIGCFNWDTSNVTNMESMFEYCYNLIQIGDKENVLDLSSWDTSNVTNMRDTFGYINQNYGQEQKVLTLNLTNWDTSKVTDMSSMFYTCCFDEITGLKGFDTSSVTTLQNTFNFCNISNFYDVENWDVSNVKNMWGLFGWYGNNDDYLTTLNLSSWNTSNVTNMNGMFNNRKNLSLLDLSGWDTSKVTDMNSMFDGCESLFDLIGIENFNTVSCKDMGAMFKSCEKIESFNLQNNGNIWNTSFVTNMHQMFYACESLNNINILGWNTAAVTNMSYMFSRCRVLIDSEINHILSNIEFNRATNISYMFEDCDNVTSITDVFTNINGVLVDASSLFTKNNSNLSLNTNIKNIITNAEYIHNMFSGINKLNISSSEFITYNMSHIKSLGNLFYRTTLDSPICFSGNFNMILGSDVMINETYNQKHTSVNGIFGYCNHGGDINNLSTFDISFGTYYNDEEFYNGSLFVTLYSIFQKKAYLHYFIPTYLPNSNSSPNYDYSYNSNRYLGGLTNIFNNDIKTSILLGDCFKDTLDNSFFKIYGSNAGTGRLLICNSENMANNIQRIYTDGLAVIYKCIVVNLTLDIPSSIASIDVISNIFNNLLNDTSHRYFDNMSFISGNDYSGYTGRHIITAIFTFSAINTENPVDYNIFKTSFTDTQICDCITHIVISNSIKYMNTSLPTSVVFNNLEEVTIYFLPITGYEVDYDPGILKSLEGNSNNININLIYDIENTDITIPTQPSNTTYNIKCNPGNETISGYNYYKYIIGDLTQI